MFVDDTQKHVSGDIRMKLHGGRATVTGRRSDPSLYDFNLATYDTGDTFDQSLAKGFIEICGLSSKIAAGATTGAGDGVDLGAQGGEQRPTPAGVRRTGGTAGHGPCGAAGSPAARRTRCRAEQSTHFDWRLAPYDIAGSAPTPACCTLRGC